MPKVSVGDKFMRPRKTVLTTGEVARICNVAPRTVSKWFDAGHLRGYRIPGSKDRRIPIEHLVRFMRAHGIPLNGVDRGGTRVLVFDADTAMCNAIRSVLTEENGFEVATAATALEAGAAAQEFKPHVIIVDVTLPDAAPKVVTRFAHSLGAWGLTCLIGTARGISDAQGHALLQEGFDGYLSKPFDAQTLIRMIEEKSSASVTADSA